ncbi:hypothetical protein PAECIP111891_06548 [Paenibacillus allorhizoplanae]|uniref:Uncharacterized protein n=1 Tax=Paenibacillus allorhizoplanae TaxID=2905648 RepID=A0ABN8HC87_9BACL|nr:hypothetical protein [Paenibacillus allorhizoplanae]CAH1229787.1 hypothetical protein PAECIP111891_06548 [Paenibacillus allorhizoplanae]
MSHNSYWYIGLSLISLTLLAYICFKKNTIRSFLHVLIMVQIAYSIETVIYIYLGSYQYHPKIIKNFAYYDSNIGALASNMLAVPVAATFLTTFRLGWFWKIVFIGFFAGVELLFVKLHIYTLYWWRIEYTSLGLPVYFMVAKWIYPYLLHPLKGWLHSLLLFMCTAPFLGTFHIIPIMVFQNRFYHPGWFTDPAHDTTAFASIYYVFGTLIVITLVKLQWKQGWIKLCVLTASFYILTLVLKNSEILDIRIWWDPYYYVLFPLLIYVISRAISKRLSFGASQASNNA